MLRGARWWAAPLVAVGLVVAFGPAAGARTAAKPVLTVAQPCTYLTTAQVQKVFAGGPVTASPGNGPASSTVCNYQVGAGGSTGTLVVALMYPFFPPPGQTAVDVVEAQHADDTVTGLTLQTLRVGTSSYADLDRSIVYVAASKKFAFYLQWLPPGVSPSNGASMSPKLQKQMVTLAKVIVVRSK
ncbi:MAG TPA: hypothetical protein VI462_10740 [Acidimicrobiia bacterium]